MQKRNAEAPRAVCHGDKKVIESVIRDVNQRPEPSVVVQSHTSVSALLAGSAATGLSLAGVNEMDVTVEVPGMAWDDYPGRQVVVAELGELAGGPPASQLFLNLQALRERHQQQQQQQQGKKEGKEEGAEEGGKLEQEGREGKEEAEEVEEEAPGVGPGIEQAGGDAASHGGETETEAEGTKEEQQGPGKEEGSVEGAAATEDASEGSVETAPEAPAAAAAGDGAGAGAAGAAPRRLMEAVLALPKARTPVVKLTVPDTKVCWRGSRSARRAAERLPGICVLVSCPTYGATVA